MTNAPTEYRDEEVGELLRGLDVPEHGTQFHAELRVELANERAARKRRLRVRWGIRLAAAAAVATAFVAAFGIPKTSTTPHLTGLDVATAAVVKAHLRKALGAMSNLSGVLIATGPTKPGAPSSEQRWQFTLDAAGDFRLDGPAHGETITYNAATGVARSAQRSASMGTSTLFYAERAGVAPGAPDQGPPTWILPTEFASYVRAVLAAGDPAVHAVTYDGRPAWRLDVDTVPNAIVPELSADRFQITVDQQTGMPVRLVETNHGAFLRELRIEDLSVNGPLANNAFDLVFPAGSEVARSDEGFRRVQLDDVAGIAGYAPLVPSSIPAGYRLAAVAVARAAGPTGKDSRNPPSQRVVSLSYRRGLDQFLVTTRLRGGGAWTDPLASGDGFTDPERLQVLGAGALAGAAAHLVVVPRTTPHLWALAGDRVVTVSGDLSGQELMDVAASLATR